MPDKHLQSPLPSRGWSYFLHFSIIIEVVWILSPSVPLTYRVGKPVCAHLGWNVYLDIHAIGYESITYTDTQTFLDPKLNITETVRSRGKKKK